MVNMRACDINGVDIMYIMIYTRTSPAQNIFLVTWKISNATSVIQNFERGTLWKLEPFEKKWWIEQTKNSASQNCRFFMYQRFQGEIKSSTQVSLSVFVSSSVYTNISFTSSLRDFCFFFSPNSPSHHIDNNNNNSSWRSKKKKLIVQTPKSNEPRRFALIVGNFISRIRTLKIKSKIFSTCSFFFFEYPKQCIHLFLYFSASRLRRS